MERTNIAEVKLEKIAIEDLLGPEALACAPPSTPFESLTLKEQNLFLLTDSKGNVSRLEHCQLGLFFDDTRFLSQWELRVLQQEPVVLSSQASWVFCNQIDLTTTWAEEAKDIYEHNFIHIRRRQVLGDRMIERLRIANYLNFAQHVEFSLQFSSDFADMFEVRGMLRERRGQYYKPVVNEQDVLLCYEGLDKIMRCTRVHFGVKPSKLDGRTAHYNVSIRPGESFLLEVHVIPSVGALPLDVPMPPYSELYQRAAEDVARWRAHCTSVSSSDEFLDSSLSQSVRDLRALMVTHRNESIIGAGIPWYSTAFGRDSIISSLQSLMVNPDIARSTLSFLAHYQGKTVSDFTAEEPGKILHEIRRGEMATCGEIPHVPYYGTIDATPLFIVLAHEYFLWTDDEQFIRQLLPSIEAALAWIDNYGDIDGDKFVEYWKFTERGILHQGWKDSVDGVIYPDATQPHLPIALVEVQGYVFDAKMRMSRLYRTLGMAEQSRKLRSEALELQDRITEKFWMKDERFFALGLDGKKRQIKSVTSNPAHLLYSQAVGMSEAGRIEKRLMSDDMYSGWGIRTFSAKHAAYNPLSYHNGTVWPHDNAIAVMGLCNYNLKRSAEQVFTHLFEACLHFQYYRLPELFCGMTRQLVDSPVHYPVACTPQAWAAATFFMMLQGLLGIRPDAPRRRLYIENPMLPRVVSELIVHDLRVGNSRVTLQISRQGERTFVNVIEQKGDPIRVTIEL